MTQRVRLKTTRTKKVEPQYASIPYCGDETYIQLRHTSEGRGVYATFCLRIITSVDHKGVTCYGLRGRGVESRDALAQKLAQAGNFSKSCPAVCSDSTPSLGPHTLAKLQARDRKVYYKTTTKRGKR